MQNKAIGYLDIQGSNKFVGFAVGEYNPSILINPVEKFLRLQFTDNDNQSKIYDYQLIGNADISYGNLGAGNFGAVEGRWQKFGQIITFAGLIQSISGASGAWGTLATIPHTPISQIWFRPLLNSTGNEPIVRDGNISGSNITAWLANEDNGKYIFFSGTYVCNN